MHHVLLKSRTFNRATLNCLFSCLQSLFTNLTKNSWHHTFAHVMMSTIHFTFVLVLLATQFSSSRVINSQKWSLTSQCSRFTYWNIYSPCLFFFFSFKLGNCLFCSVKVFTQWKQQWVFFRRPLILMCSWQILYYILMSAPKFTSICTSPPFSLFCIANHHCSVNAFHHRPVLWHSSV